jgi:hypothetical protein
LASSTKTDQNFSWSLSWDFQLYNQAHPALSASPIAMALQLVADDIIFIVFIFYWYQYKMYVNLCIFLTHKRFTIWKYIINYWLNICKKLFERSARKNLYSTKIQYQLFWHSFGLRHSYEINKKNFIGAVSNFIFDKLIFFSWLTILKSLLF